MHLTQNWFAPSGAATQEVWVRPRPSIYEGSAAKYTIGRARFVALGAEGAA